MTTKNYHQNGGKLSASLSTTTAKKNFHFGFCAQVKILSAFYTQRSQTTHCSLPSCSSGCLLFRFFVTQYLTLAPISPLTFHLGSFFSFRGSVAWWDLSAEKCSHNANLSTPLFPRLSSPRLCFFSPSGCGTKRPFRSVWLLISGRSSGGGGEGPATGRQQNAELRFPLPHLRFHPISALDEPG